VFEHGVKMFGLLDHVVIIYLAAFFGERFTSCPGVRSSILSKKQNFIRHFFSLFNLNGLNGAKKILLLIIANGYKKDRINLFRACQ